MWPLFTRRRRVRWLAIALTSILIVWSLIVYKSLTISYPPEPPQRQPVSASSFLFDIDNLDLFLARTPVKYNYHVFYYPWYGNPEHDAGRYLHWNHRRLAHWNREKALKYPQHRHEPPDDIGSNFYPWLGAYSSRSPALLDKHMKMIRMSGAGTLSVSWYPPGMADDEGQPWDDLMPLLLDTADKYKLKVCFHIEPYKNRTAVNVIEWTVYILRQYGSHAAFYRYRDKPVFYIYDSYQIPSEDWRRQLVSAERRSYFIGLILKGKDCRQLALSGFDAAYSYFAASGFTEASTPSRWSAIANKCQPLPFIPSVGPGYIDTNVRPWNGETTRLRNNGNYYRDSFRSLPSMRNETIVTITSFNEWGEGTQIEPAADGNPTKMLAYESYHQGPFTYIYLTRELIFASRL